MNLDAFCELAAVRIPTPGEFIAFAEGQGWTVGARNGKGYLKADPRDPLALALAKMLSREPYRTNVLAELSRRADFDHGDDARPDTIITDDGKEPYPPGEPLPATDECPVLRAGEATPKAAVTLLGSTRPGSAYRNQLLSPPRLYPWEERRDGQNGQTYFRVYTRSAVCCLRPPAFESAFVVESTR